jgi:hypothetical protein
MAVLSMLIHLTEVTFKRKPGYQVEKGFIIDSESDLSPDRLLCGVPERILPNNIYKGRKFV